MADIELVIKIDEEQYEFIKQSMTMDKVKDYPALLYAICEHVKNGTQLPKGHERLIDAGEYENDIRKHYFDNSTVIRCTEIALDNAPTIIEADTESEE